MIANARKSAVLAFAAVVLGAAGASGGLWAQTAWPPEGAISSLAAKLQAPAAALKKSSAHAADDEMAAVLDAVRSSKCTEFSYLIFKNGKAVLNWTSGGELFFFEQDVAVVRRAVEASGKAAHLVGVDIPLPEYATPGWEKAMDESYPIIAQALAKYPNSCK